MNEDEDEDEEGDSRIKEEEEGLDESMLELVKLMTGERGVDAIGRNDLPCSIECNGCCGGCVC